MPPIDRRVGALDRPERYGSRRSVAVYQNSLGFYIKLDGCREKVHGAQLWTSTSHVKMRGALPVGAAPRRAAHAAAGAWGDDSDDDSDDDGDDADLAAAIAASLAEVDGGGDGGHGEESADEGGGGGAPDREDAAPDAAGDAAGDAPGGSSGHASGGTCVICLTEPAVMLMRSCNHVCGCAGCARRLVNRPCPLCRRLVTKTERVFF